MDNPSDARATSQARELLALECEADGLDYMASLVRRGETGPDGDRCVRDIKAALALPKPALAVGEIDAVAQFLHDEGDFADAWQATWPEHPDDTGQREGGFVRIVPKDVVAKFRDVARRLLIRHPSAALPAPLEGDLVAVEKIAGLIETQADCLIHYAEQSGEAAKPLPSVYHLQAGHFRDLAADLRKLLASAPPAPAEDQELQEIADGAYGDGPFIRGLARDRLAALTPAPAGVKRSDEEEIAKPRCLCPHETVRRVIKEHGTCAMGGCPYGGDF